MTEFTSADGLARTRESKRKRYLTYYDDEHPISAQLSAQPRHARRLRAHRPGLRLRPGRPQPRLPRQARSPLQRRLRPAARPSSSSASFAPSAPPSPSPSPSSSAWMERRGDRLRRLARLAQDCGLNAVALHARTREDGYTARPAGSTRRRQRRRAHPPHRQRRHPTPEDAAAMVHATRCDAIMIGRGAPANPWIFRQIAQYTASKEASGVGCTTSRPMQIVTA